MGRPGKRGDVLTGTRRIDMPWLMSRKSESCLAMAAHRVPTEESKVIFRTFNFPDRKKFVRYATRERSQRRTGRRTVTSTSRVQ